MKLTNYVLTFTDNKGNSVLCKNDGSSVDISEKPFYKSRDNAEKAISKINNTLKTLQEKRLFWYEKVQNAGLYSQDDSQRNLIVDSYENGELILANGLEIKEVIIEINL